MFLHSFIRHNAVGATGLVVANDLPLTVNFHAAENVLWPEKTIKVSKTARAQKFPVPSSLPSNASKVRRVPGITNMDPAAYAGPSRAALGTGTSCTGAGAPSFPRLYKTEAAWGGECLCLALQARIIGGMFCENIVEDGEEAWVAFERVRRRRVGGRGANCERRLGRSSIEEG